MKKSIERTIKWFRIMFRFKSHFSNRATRNSVQHHILWWTDSIIIVIIPVTNAHAHTYTCTHEIGFLPTTDANQQALAYKRTNEMYFYVRLVIWTRMSLSLLSRCGAVEIYWIFSRSITQMLEQRQRKGKTVGCEWARYASMSVCLPLSMCVCVNVFVLDNKQ